MVLSADRFFLGWLEVLGGLCLGSKSTSSMRLEHGSQIKLHAGQERVGKELQRFKRAVCVSGADCGNTAQLF